jgi:hypothetical protein
MDSDGYQKGQLLTELPLFFLECHSEASQRSKSLISRALESFDIRSMPPIQTTMNDL